MNMRRKRKVIFAACCYKSSSRLGNLGNSQPRKTRAGLSPWGDQPLKRRFDKSIKAIALASGGSGYPYYEIAQAALFVSGSRSLGIAGGTLEIEFTIRSIGWVFS